jgi:predicted transcriptional regulator
VIGIGGSLMAERPELSGAEREVLKVLWDKGPGTIREINKVLTKSGRRWAYTTVATLLQRLAGKRYVASDPTTVPHIYRAEVSRDQLLERRLRDTADELCDGRAAPLVLALVQGNQFSADEVARLQHLLEQAAKGSSRPPRAKS